MEKYLKGVNGELTYDELRSICQTEVPKGNYYNYEKIRSVLLRKLNGELDDKYFHTWLIVVAWALYQEEYKYISWAFDGFSFQDTFDKKLVLEIMANLKDYDYKIRYKNFIEQHKKDGLKVVVIGNGNIVIDQYPLAKTKMIAGDLVILKTNDINRIMPSFINLSYKEASKLCEMLSINCEFEGNGYVYSQSVDEKEIITNETSIKLSFKEKE